MLLARPDVVTPFDEEMKTQAVARYRASDHYSSCNRYRVVLYWGRIEEINQQLVSLGSSSDRGVVR